MTDHNDATERALEKITNTVTGPGNSGSALFDWLESVRTILTDLAAEKYNEGMEYGSIIRCRDRKARLDAVREWRDSFGGDLPEYVGQEAYDQLDSILDGEGGEQVSQEGESRTVPPTAPATPDAIERALDRLHEAWLHPGSISWRGILTDLEAEIRAEQTIDTSVPTVLVNANVWWDINARLDEVDIVLRRADKAMRMGYYAQALGLINDAGAIAQGDGVEGVIGEAVVQSSEPTSSPPLARSEGGEQDGGPEAVQVRDGTADGTHPRPATPDAIERALEQAQKSGVLEPDQRAVDIARSILTDLAAEIRTEMRDEILTQWSDCPECGFMVSVDEDGCCVGCGRDALRYGPPLAEEAARLRARLAAVVERCEREGQQNDASTAYGRGWLDACSCLLALARGEGGEQATPEAANVSATPTGPVEAEREPATPDLRPHCEHYEPIPDSGGASSPCNRIATHGDYCEEHAQD